MVRRQAGGNVVGDRGQAARQRCAQRPHTRETDMQRRNKYFY